MLLFFRLLHFLFSVVGYLCSYYVCCCSLSRSPSLTLSISCIHVVTTSIRRHLKSSEQFKITSAFLIIKSVFSFFLFFYFFNFILFMPMRGIFSFISRNQKKKKKKSKHLRRRPCIRNLLQNTLFFGDCNKLSSQLQQNIPSNAF